MFTGLIKQRGRVASIARRGEFAEITVEWESEPPAIEVGDSISINGVCLTVTKLSGRAFYLDVSFETLSKTTLGKLSAGERVNLETPLTPSDGFHGHIVLGHIDGMGEVVSVIEREGVRVIRISYPGELAPYLAVKGSIAVEGVSLTINEVDKGSFTVVIIPHTSRATTLGEKKKGDKVNLEADVIARYIERQLAVFGKGIKGTEEKRELTIEDLKEKGYL
ncbi:MAG: riboflavin synthase [Myxococcota bacterium]